MNKIDPEKDGIDHINIYSKGKTELGRFLTNFAHTPFETSEDGKFASIEGYWYWLSVRDEKLRDLSGFSAKKYGQEAEGLDWLESEEFKTKIKNAIIRKIELYNRTEDVVYSNLPFDHYYNFGGKIVKPKEGQWIIDFFNGLRFQE